MLFRMQLMWRSASGSGGMSHFLYETQYQVFSSINTQFISLLLLQMYLSQYGWLDPSARKPGSAALLDVRGAVKDFQAFAGLNQTGELDDETLMLMSESWNYP